MPTGSLVSGLVLALLLLHAPPAGAQWDAWLKKPGKPPRYPRILVEASSLPRAATGDRVLLDARPLSAFEAGHIPGARHLDPRNLSPMHGALEAALRGAGVPAGARIACYSDAASPEAAGRLFWHLELTGREDVEVLNGGFDAWKRLGRTTERGPVSMKSLPLATGSHRDAERSGFADSEYVRENFGRPGVTIMDWRSPEEWSKGHIPHSLPFPLASLLNSDGTIMDGPAMRPYFEEFGPRLRDYVNLEDEFVVCGDTPADLPIHPYLALRIAGIERVRCYAAGFSGWRSLPDAPVVRIVDAEEVRKLLRPSWVRKLGAGKEGRVLVVDLRAEGEHGRGHLPGAVWMPIQGFGPALEAHVARKFPGADRRRLPVLFYCYGPTCIRSRNCSTEAARLGFGDLLWFRDGTLGWKQIGEKLEE